MSEATELLQRMAAIRDGYLAALEKQPDCKPTYMVDGTESVEWNDWHLKMAQTVREWNAAIREERGSLPQV